MKIEKNQDYWTIQMMQTQAEIKAATYDYPNDRMNEWNMFPSRAEAERALARIVLLLTEPSDLADYEGTKGGK